MKYALKELIYNWRRYLLIETLVILLMFMVLFLSGLASGLGHAVSASIYGMPATSFIIVEDAEDMISASRLSSESMDLLQKENLGETGPLIIQRAAIKQKTSSDKLDIIYFGIEPDSFINPNASEGEKLDSKPNTIILNNTYKDVGIEVGDIVEDTTTNTEFEVIGFTKDEMYAHVAVGYVSLETYETLLTDSNPNAKLTYNALAIKDTVDSNGIDTTVNVDKNTIIQNLPAYQAEQLSIQMILWVLVFISGSVLGVFFYIITLQKVKQFGVLKAIGSSNSSIAINQVLQILILAGFGILIGNGLAYGIANILPSKMPFFLEPNRSLIVSMAFLGISLISSSLSVRAATKIDPIITINGGEA